mmetsp:Transcript_10218/g.29178  ORF Transcript_10218/g.29178 Transcript_10218/m.29178 type:complete len:240 (-) Transcript_10218:153-872(-)
MLEFVATFLDAESWNGLEDAIAVRSHGAEHMLLVARGFQLSVACSLVRGLDALPQPPWIPTRRCHDVHHLGVRGGHIGRLKLEGRLYRLVAHGHQDLIPLVFLVCRGKRASRSRERQPRTRRWRGRSRGGGRHCGRRALCVGDTEDPSTSALKARDHVVQRPGRHMLPGLVLQSPGSTLPGRLPLLLPSNYGFSALARSAPGLNRSDPDADAQVLGGVGRLVVERPVSHGVHQLLQCKP